MTKEEELLWEEIYKTARISALRTVKIGRHLITQEDVYQSFIVWSLEHWHKIEEWKSQDSLSFKLRKTFNNEGQKIIAKERSARNRSPISDGFYYTTDLLHTLLRDIWRYEGWLTSPDMTSEFVSKTSKPSEGNNRLAMFSDVAAAVKRLNDSDQQLLRLKYEDGGQEFGEIATTLEISEEAARKRVSRAIRKLQDKLGGEIPTWHGRRRVISNAQARAELE